MNSQPNQPEITTSYIIALSTALEAKLETIVGLSEDFHRKQDLMGMIGCTLSMMNPMALAEGFPENITSDQEKQIQDPERQQAATEAKARLNALMKKTEELRYTKKDDDPSQPTDQQVATIQLTSSAIDALSDAQAIKALTNLMRDHTLDPDLRWSAYGLAQGITDHSDIPQALDDITNHEAWETVPETRTRIMEEVATFQKNNGSWEGTLIKASHQLCRESGIDRPSDEMIERPGIIRDMALTKDTSKRHQLTIDIGADHEGFIDGVMFTYRDITHLKTISEPFPQGFPAPRAAQIAKDYLSKCENPDRLPQEADWNHHRQTGLNALRIAQLELHCVSDTDIIEFIDTLTEILPSDSEMVSHVMRIITWRDDQTQDALLQGMLKTTPTTTNNGANRIIKAARRTGLRQTELWELARLLRVDPGQYGINRPTLDEETLEQIVQAATDAGIPDSLIAMVREETTENR